MRNKYLVMIYRIIIVAFIGTQVVQVDAFNSVTRADDTVTDFELVDDEQLKISAKARVDMKKKQITWDVDAEKKTDEDQLGLEFDDTDANLKKMSDLKINGISKEIAANNQYILSTESERKLNMTFVTELNDENAEKATLKLKPLLMNKTRKITQQKEYDMTVIIPKVADTTNNASNSTSQQSSSSREHKTSSSSSSSTAKSSSSEDSDDADADADADEKQSSKEESKKDDSEKDADKESEKDDEDSKVAGATTYTVPTIASAKSINALAGNIGEWEDPTKNGYTENNEGKFPTSYWNVKDSEDSSDADKDANYRNYIAKDKDNSNKTTNYFGYGQNGDEGNESAFWLKKYVEPVEGSDDTYKVNLNVRGNDYAPLPEIDVVLVLDRSGSMSGNMNDLKESADNFIDTVWGEKDAQKAVKIGVVSYSGESTELNGLTSYSTANIATLKKNINSMTANGGTFIQNGIRKAHETLGKGNPDAQKNMVVMSDGAPTYSYRTTKTVNNDGKINEYGFEVPEFKNNSTQKRGVGWETSRSGSGSSDALSQYTTSDGYKVSTNSFSTVSEAVQTKNDTNMYSVMFKTNEPSAEYTMKNIADGEKNFYPAENSAAMLDAFTHIARGLVRTVSNATIADPMGEYIEAVPGSGKITAISGDGVADSVELNVNNKHVSASGITLGKDEEIQISYEIKISDDAPNNKFIQANGETTLTPNSNSIEKANFGIPSVRIGKESPKDAKIPIWKIDGDGDLIENSSADFEIFKSDENGEEGDSIATVTTKNGKLEFTDLDEGYYLIKETKAPDGFEKSNKEILVKVEWNGRTGKWTVTNVNDKETVTDADPIKVENTLKEFELSFTKIDEDKKDLEDAKFELKDSDDETVDLTVEGATFSAKGLKPGKYTLSETEKPNEDLHQIAPINIEISKDGKVTVESSDDSEGAFNPIWDFNQDDQKITFDVMNTEKEKIDISGEKIWKDNNDQSGERPESIEVQLQRRASKSDEWENVDNQSAETSAKDNWQYVFTGLPEYTDESHTTKWMYQVVEVDTPEGYDSGAGEKEYDIVNTIKDYNYEVNKVDSNGDALKGAEFTLTDNDGEKIKISDDSTDVKFIWNNLAPGKYTLEETKSPDQHHGKNNKYEVVVHNDGTIDTNPITKGAEVKEAKDDSVKIVNNVNDFKLNFVKVGEDGKEQLSGAKFTISDVDGDFKEELEGFGEVGSEFEVKSLEAGKTYELKETKAPNGHALLRDPIQIQIGTDGKVTVKDASDITVTDKDQTSTISFNVKNKDVPKTELNGTKKWIDDDKYGDRPDKLTIQLQQRVAGTETWHDYRTQDIDKNDVELDEDVWEFKFTGLPTENTEGQKYEYRVKETNIPDHYEEILINSSTIENRHIHYDYEVNKVDAEGESLAGAKFELTNSDGKVIKIDDSSTDSKFVWKDLKVGEYTLEETKAPDQHHGENSKFKVTVNKDGSTNTEAITKNVDFKEAKDDSVEIVNNVNDFELNFTKKDEDGKETLKGAEFTLKDEEGKEIVLKESDGTFHATGLKADSSYELKEIKAPDDYSLLRDPINIKVDAKGKVTVDKAENLDVTDNNDVTEISFDVNNQPIEPITFEGTKVWDDNNDKYGERPDSLTVQLQRRLSGDTDWENYKTQKIDAENVDLDEHVWEFKFTDVPKENNLGQTYQYRVRETNVPENYTEDYNDADRVITNKHVQHHFDYEVNKVDTNGKALAGAEFKLTDSKGKVVTKDESSTDSKFVWKELDVGEYTLEETKAPDQHHGVNNKFKVTVNKDGSVNTEPITKNVDFKENAENSVNIVNDVNDFELNFTKKDENGKEILKGAEFELKDSEDKAIELKESDGNFQATGLKADSSYVLQETKAPSGYSLLRDPINIKIDAKGEVTVVKAENLKVTDNNDVTEISCDVYNQPVDTTTFKGTKEWVDFNNKNDSRPNELEMVLQQQIEGSDDWKDFKTQTIKGGDENSWNFEFTDLPTENEQGKKYSYQVDEVDVPEDYEQNRIDDSTIQNSYLPGRVIINGEKEWDDMDNGQKLRPGSVEFSLENNVDGKWEEIETVKTTAEDNWKFSFNVKEQESDQYRVVEKTSVDPYEDPVYYDGDGNKVDMNAGFEVKEGSSFDLKAVNAIESKGGIKLNKFDANGKETTDATFELKHAESGNVVNTKEKFVWDNVIAGDYILVETAAGDGMTVNHKEYQVTVDNDGKVTIKNGDDAIRVNDNNEIDYRNWLSSISKNAQQSHAQIGDTISWDIQTILPASFASFKDFNMSDQLNSNFRHAGSEVSLTIEKADGSTSEVALDKNEYQLIEENNKVTINLLSADFTGGKDVLVNAIKSAGFNGTVKVNWEIQTKVVALDGDNPLRNEVKVDWTDGGGHVDPISDADEVKPAKNPSIPTTGNPWMMIITLIGGALVLLGIWLLKKRSKL